MPADVIAMAVTQENIDEAKKLRKYRVYKGGHFIAGRDCPIGLAAQRVFGTRRVGVSSASVGVTLFDKHGTYFHDSSKFVEAFDNMEPVEPTVVLLKMDSFRRNFRG